MKKNIHSRAKNEGFGWLKHEILHVVRRLLVFLLPGYGARAVFFSGKSRGRKFRVLYSRFKAFATLANNLKSA